MDEAKLTVTETPRFDEFLARTGIVMKTDEITILPDNYESVTSSEEAIFAGPGTTVKKLFDANGVKTEFVAMKAHAWSGDNRGADWFGPTLFISSLMLTENQHAVSVALNVLSNYLSAAFGIGSSNDRGKARLNILVKDEATGVTKKVTYEGPIDGLKELKEVLQSAVSTEK